MTDLFMRNSYEWKLSPLADSLLGRVLFSVSFSCKDISACLVVLLDQWTFLVAVH